MPSIRRAACVIRRLAPKSGQPLPSCAPRSARRLTWVAPLVFAACLVRPAAAGPIELVSADERGVTLRLSVERYDLGPPGEDGSRELLIPRLDLLDLPGRPKLPFATALVALPPGAGASITVTGDGAEETVDGVRLTSGERPVVRADPDGLGYVPAREPVAPILDGPWPAAPAEVGEPFTLRRQRVVVVQILPFRYDPAAGRLWTRRTLTVRVAFTGAPSAPSAPGAPTEDRGWEPVLRSTLLNYEQGRRWREPRPALGRGLFERPRGERVGPAGAQAAAAFDENEPEVRVRIAATGAWALDATELLGKDYPAGVPIEEVSVHRHEFVPNVLAPLPPYVTFEVPIEVEDADGDGFFTAGDRIVLYAQSWWERSGLAFATPLSHAQHNWGDADYVYATRVRAPSLGLRILPRSGWSGVGRTPLASYPYRQRWEQNPTYITAPRDTTQDPYMWITRPEYYRRAELPFTISDLDTTMSVSVGASWTGLLATYDHWVWFSVKNGAGQVTSVVDSFRASGKVTVSRGGTLFGSALSDGADTNRFVMWGKRLDAPPHRSTNPSPDVALGYFEVTYGRRYRAIQGSLSCNSGSAFGDYEIFATGFTDSAALRVYDVTDSSAIRRLVAVPKEAAGGGFGVRFQDNTTAGAARRYLVFDTPRAPAPADYGRVDRAALANLYDRRAGDYLLIVPEAFAGAVGPLVALRRSQGLDVVLAPLEAVNDAFNGGRKSPWAIKRFVRHAYDNWDARFVLLVGDGSEDPQQTAGYYSDGTPISSADWVPTQRVMGPVPATGPEESFFQAIVSDTWYVWCVDCGSASLAPKVPDLHIGRLPVNSLAAASAVVNKIVSYESVTPDQTWRRKMVLVSDDAYSGNTFGVITAPSTYCRQPQETVFKTINDRCRSIILDEAGLGQSEPEVFNLSYYLPNYASDLTPCPQPGPPDTCRCRGADFITRARGDAHHELFKRLNEGRLWWNFQGHANETVLSHEAFYANRYNNLPDDKDELVNYGKPFLFTAFSCHPNAFGHYKENRSAPFGPSLGEDMVNLADRGAIASWASTGFELLPSSSTRHINVMFARALFADPPREPQAFDPVGGARVVLGEVISKAEIDHYPLAQFSTYERDVMISYNLLGDPATRITVGSPQAIFRANGAPVTDGVPVRLFTIGDTLRIEGDLVSNARIDTAWVERIEGTNIVATALADSLTPAFPDTTDASGGGRRYRVVYRTHLTAGTYTYRFRTVDRYGTPGQFDAVFRFQTQFSAEGGVIRDGDVVGPNAAFSYLVLSPSPLVPANDLALFLNGQPLPFTATPANNDQSGREWVLTWAHGPYPDGSYRLDLNVLGARAATHTFQVQSRLQIQNPLAFPNPFNDERGAVFSFYLESDRPAKVMVRVYAISGRMIYERTGSVAAAGYQQIQWDGKDAEGGSLANGVYFYRLAVDNGASSSRYEGRLVKLTKPHNVSEEQAP